MRLSSRYSLVICAALGLGAALTDMPSAEARDRSDMRGEGASSPMVTNDGRRASPGLERRGRSESGAGLRVSTSGERRTAGWRDQRAAWRDDLRRSGHGNRQQPQSKKWRDLQTSDRLYALNGGFIYAMPSDLIVDDVYDGGGGSRFVTIDPGLYEAYRAAYGTLSYPSQPRIIDVETERLDRRQVGPSGIEITHTGGAKIIRIAPDYKQGVRHAERGAAPLERARPGDRRAVSPADLQPWSAGWLKYCSEAHYSFDPELGTYLAKDGRVRFCER